METQQKTSVSKETKEKTLSELSPDELGERLVGAKMAIREAENYVAELNTELLNRVGRGQVIYVSSPEVMVGKELVRPVASVEIRHKSRSSLKYREDQVIRILKEALANPYANGLVYTEDPKERLDRKTFEARVFEDDDLASLRPFVRHSESDWIEVRGLPK